MSRLTTKEKEHWNERISQRIKRAIDKLWTSEVGLKAKFEEEARKSITSQFSNLPFAELVQAVEKSKALIQESNALSEVKHSLRKQILAGLSVDIAERDSHYYVNDQYSQTMKEKADQEMAEVMSKHPIGREILELKREKDELLDTVWLATSSAQIKELWSKFSDVVKDEPTRMQREAIEMPPVEDEVAKQ